MSKPACVWLLATHRKADILSLGLTQALQAKDGVWHVYVEYAVGIKLLANVMRSGRIARFRCRMRTCELEFTCRSARC